MSSLLAALVLALLAAPSYSPLKLHELIGLADLMVTGTIVEVREETVVVEVAKVGFGESPPRIVVRRFQNWSCASRWAEYAVDQRCIYFLAAGKNSGDPYWILSGGGEGERPLENDQSLVTLWSLGKQPIAVEVLMSEARRYREHFRFVERLEHGWTIERCRSDQDLAAYAESSNLARTLARETFEGPYVDPLAPSPAPPGSTPRWDLGLGPLPTALVALPDLDRDGIDELVCAQGSLWILWFESGGELRKERFAGDRLLGGTCTALAYLGDLDRDGTLELAAGDPEAAEGGAYRGAVRIFSLAAGGGMERSAKITLDAAVFGGVQTAFAGFGRTLASIGDLDGDGRAELAVSESSNSWGPGQVWILFLDAIGQPTRATPLYEEGKALGGTLHLAAPGDLDRDGIPDLLTTSNGGGLSVVFLERDGRIRDRVDHSRSGGVHSLAVLGDVDVDGTLELAVGSGKAIHLLSLAHDGAVQRECELGPSRGVPEALPERARFGAVLSAWPREGRQELVVAGFSWIEPLPWKTRHSRSFPSLWFIDPR